MLVFRKVRFIKAKQGGTANKSVRPWQINFCRGLFVYVKLFTYKTMAQTILVLSKNKQRR